MKIAIDAGHGGTAHGAEYNGMVEMSLNLETAQALEHHCRCCGMDASLIRHGDYNMSLKSRGWVAGNLEADLVVSIHYNANRDSSLWGAEAYHWPGNKLGKQVASSILQAFPLGLRTRKVFAADTNGIPGDADDWLERPRAVIGAYACTAVLVECGYLTSPRDVLQIQLQSTQHAIARAIHIGLCDAQGAPDGV